ncbi:hypothetical protein DFQ28_009662 [Apophysomyces sp. BC1034]|nr:hypothetical protein DFQ30_009911 [Apophysomyces sp. BC1015]KAG0182096.1 hypothetical protein DFQ29_005790 [Apophysomyces sp. BC1021]KAG0192257.1 hypothetical protein DFQ28_009662 [Apophysomyces sp. BC1034]
MSSGTQSIADLTTETKQTSGEMPPPLVGASTTVVGNQLYVFGGRLVSSRQMTNHLYVLDLTTLVWTRHIAPPDSADPPRPRYFHSTNIYEHYLVIFGGMSQSRRRSSQGLCALDDVCLFDLDTMSWVHREAAPSLFSPQARYAHIAVCWNNKLVVMGGQDMLNQYINEVNVFDLDTFAWIQGGPLERQLGAYRSVAFAPSGLGMGNAPFWADSDSMEPPVCVYSNYNFAEVTRDLQSFRPMQCPAQFKDHSVEMSGAVFPPGLRFPTGELLGHHMVLTGTYLTPTHQAFHLWALNLANLVWVRIDTGSNLTTGSWNRGVLNHANQKFYVLGNRDRVLLEDYNHRQVNFDHVAIVDLEAFGIYSYPEETCAPVAQELGLSMLNEPGMADMDIVTADRNTIPANSTILAQRWPYFKQMLKDQPAKSLSFPENYPVTLAFLQFIYTDHLLTAQQHQPYILSRLLLLGGMYEIPRLVQLTTHALHQILTISTASMVYETAALTNQTALQIRSLRVMINAKKMLRQQQQQQEYPPMAAPPIPPSRRSREDYYSRSNDSEDARSSTLRRLAASRSTTTPEPDFIPMPRMSKSGTMNSFERQRKGSVASQNGKLPHFGIRF